MEHGAVSTCQLWHSMLRRDAKEQNVKLASASLSLHRKSLFKSDNQNIVPFEILVIWFALVSFFEKESFQDACLKNLCILVSLNQIHWGSSINKQGPKLQVQAKQLNKGHQAR